MLAMLAHAFLTAVTATEYTRYNAEPDLIRPTNLQPPTPEHHRH
jgi:hypothetical protein